MLTWTVAVADEAQGKERGRQLPEGSVGFDDINVGDWMQTDAVEVTAEMIDAFADLTGDRFEIHMDEEAARQKGFKGRVAHGLLVLSLVDTLKNHTRSRLRAVASLAWDWSFDAPVLAGDTVEARVEVVGKRRTSKEGRGIVDLRFKVTNQRGETVQSGENKLMVNS